MQTPTAELIGIKLGAGTSEWITARRTDGWSFGRIAAEIYARTGVYVTAQTIKTWSAERAAS